MNIKTFPPQSKTYSAIRSFKNQFPFKKGDYLILFGEVFNRGYANGLIEEATKHQMQIIYSTVGRREKDLSLRALNTEELSAAKGPLINIPLEAGFDMEGSPSPTEQMKDIKLSEWPNAKIDFASVQESILLGRKRFLSNVRKYIAELEPLIKPGHNVYFAHLMAGGVPRAKIIMPLMNRTFKGIGDRFLESEVFWQSDLGKLCQLSFDEVTAETFKVLIDETTSIRDRVTKQGNRVCYSGFGYHGTEIFGLDPQGVAGYRWQTYSPYLQGWAKKRLEDYSVEYSKKGIHCCVYNCPEILTNSSAIFQGVEVCLYPFLFAIKAENPEDQNVQKNVKAIMALLKPEATESEILKLCTDYLYDSNVKKQCRFEDWPTHNTKEQLQIMLQTSEKLHELHVDPKNSITAPLSELILKGCGKVMLEDVFDSAEPVRWINHDVLAKIRH